MKISDDEQAVPIGQNSGEPYDKIEALTEQNQGPQCAPEWHMHKSRGSIYCDAHKFV